MNVPSHIGNHRRETCQRCPTPCEFQKDAGFRLNGDNECPQGRWMAFKTFVKSPVRGLGDLVAKVAEPIAGLLDKTLKTKVKGCAACAKRKEMLNQYMPLSFLNRETKKL